MTVDSSARSRELVSQRALKTSRSGIIFIHSMLVVGHLALGVPTTGNSGENPGRPRRCERVSVGSSYLLAIVAFVTRRPDASKLVSQKTCLHVLCGVLRGTDATLLKFL